jgi:N-dimethylarginine dimethylaminohydrolase
VMAITNFNNALVRTPSRSVVRGLRAVDVGAPSYEGVLAEHAGYVDALEAAGVAVEPRRESRRAPVLSHAAIAGSSWAA